MLVLSKKFFGKQINDHITVATPAISASNSDNSGASVTLTCTSTSDSNGFGTYEWKLDGVSLYVLSSLFALVYRLVNEITINFHRNSGTGQIYTVQSLDISATGDYTCIATVSNIASSESSSYSLSATGILILKMIYHKHIMHIAYHFIYFMYYFTSTRPCIEKV